MKDYSNYHFNNDKLKHKGEKLFDLQFKNSHEGFQVTFEDAYMRNVIIQQHTNPMNDRLEDKMMLYVPLDDEYIQWGSIITSGYDEDSPYMVITEPHNNGIYNTCKIRKLQNESSFTIDGINKKYNCLLNNTKLYDDGSYVGNSNVFEDEDMRSMVVKYDVNTSKLKLFDNIVVDGEMYKVILVDKYTMKRYKEEFGVLQLVLIKTIFGTIRCNGGSILGILKYAQMKERIYNSKARELICEHNAVNTGDYIEHSYTRDSYGNTESRTYMIYSEIDMKNNYDTTFCLLCDKKINIVSNTGGIKEYYMYIDDNKTMIRDSSIGVIENKDVSSTWGSIRMTSDTMKLGETIKRFLVKHIFDNGEYEYKAYSIIGKDDMSLGGVIKLSLKKDELDARDDLVNGIAYNEGISVKPTPNPTSIIGDSDLYFYDENTYSVDTSNMAIWSCVDTFVQFVNTTNNSCIIKVDYDSKLINKIIILVATINGVRYEKSIKLRNS